MKRFLSKIDRFYIGFYMACFITITSIMIASCSEEFYFGKTLDELNAEMTETIFKTDSILMDINATLQDSIAK